MSAGAAAGCPTCFTPCHGDVAASERLTVSGDQYLSAGMPGRIGPCLLSQLARGRISEVVQRSHASAPGLVRVWLGCNSGVAISNLPGTSVRQCRAETPLNRLFVAVPAYDGLSHGSSCVVLFSGSQCVHTCRGCWSGFPVAPGGGGDDGSALMTTAGDGMDACRLWCTATSATVVMLAATTRLPSVAMIIGMGRRRSLTR